MKQIFTVFFWIITILAFGQSKLAPSLSHLEASRKESSAKSTFIVKTDQLQDFLNQYGGQIRIIRVFPEHQVAFVESTFSLLIDEWIPDSNVLFIDLNRIPFPESVLDYSNFNVNRIRKAQSEFPSITGEDLVIAIKEEQFKDDIDLRGKKIESDLETNSSSSQHATDMATIISGRGNTHPKNTGAVPDASLVSSNYLNLMPDDSDLLENAGIHTENHSYGVGIENYYGTEAEAYDAEIYQHPTIVHVFSSGNYGSLKPGDGSYKDLPFANLTGTFKQAKNLITVSAIDTALQISKYASRGPAFDGRIKPEFCAYGGAGTSDAAAMVTGVVAMIQDHYLKTNGEFPEIPLVKALMIAGADDIGTPGPDFYAGYGSVNASKSLKILSDQSFQTLRMNADETQTLQLEIPENTHELRIAICWADPAASINATKALVNDFDSKLTLGDQTWLPWILDSTPTENALNNPATRGEDHSNNAEFISITSPAAGNYTLHISAPSLLNTENVHIAWQITSKNSFDWDYPVAGNQLSAGAKELIFWSQASESIGEVFWREANGEWQALSNTSTHSLAWKTPEKSGSYQLKMILDGVEFLSEVFGITEEPNLAIGFNCDQKFGLQWNQIAGAEQYEIYEMGDTDLLKVGTTTDTIFSISKNEDDHLSGTVPEFYAVKPVFPEFTGLPNTAINYKFQGVFCYFNFFSAERSEQIPVTIKLSLSTTANIDQIDILKFAGDEQTILSEIHPNNTLEYHFYDPTPTSGLMSYQAILHFSDGSVMESELSEIMIEKEGAAILFPNPTSDGYLYVLSEGTGQNLQIIDADGKLILEQELYYDVETIIVDDLRQGLYFYRLIENKKVIDSGKFIVK